MAGGKIQEAVALLRQAAAELETNLSQPNNSRLEDAVTVPISCSQSFLSETKSTSSTIATPEVARSTASEVRRLFSPYNRRRPTESRPSLTRPMVKWAHKFSCLASKDQDYVPQKEMKRTLLEAGLGEKRIAFDKTNSAQEFQQKILECYPKLRNGGGFKLLRTCSRTLLELIKPSMYGYSAEYLADSCSLGQSVVYIRPIQKDIDLEYTDSLEPSVDCPKEVCITCLELIPIINLKEHVSHCAKEQREDVLPILKRTKIDPICHFACVKELILYIGLSVNNAQIAMKLGMVAANITQGKAQS